MILFVQLHVVSVEIMMIKSAPSERNHVYLHYKIDVLSNKVLNEH